MSINCYSVTFWFNIFDNHSELLKSLSQELKDEYQEFSYNTNINNLISPIIIGVNNEEMTNIRISRINLQYTMDKVTKEDITIFKERVLKLFEILTNNNVEVLHSSVFMHCDMIKSKALAYRCLFTSW